ncbi:SWIM zinc finger family protein [Hymenobacter metallicola]|uniref:SWIM zinc finger family protein n=1 Tax=Hymenobacter metallicola TaxID=2563114 RepID=A0A4Z0QGE6_9BACT|nr:SWIM zinc finger family protein [Hymenobacter metallicola]TGE28556.1 SWIM zinc finger family protein [Hymenobacter metallicola]
MTWTEEQVRALVTDAGTLKRGQELATPAKWSKLGQTPTAVWGECAGSGSKPYQTGIDLLEPAFKCSCPSRVFPCKHGAGLLLLLARQPQLPPPAGPPSWLAEWLSKRQTRQQGQAAKETPPGEAPDPAARQKREAQRLERMQRSAEELEIWLLDIIRNGLASLDKQPAAFWEQQAARLVDGQLPGLAAVVRELAGLRYVAANWPELLLARLGELYLLLGAFRNLPQLSEAARQEVRQLLGVSIKKEELLAQQPAVADTWRVLGQISWEEERLTARRTWLWGQTTQRYALVLEFAFGGQPFATALVPEGSYAGSVVYYPGLQPLRAVPGPLTFQGIRARVAQAALPLPALLEQYAAALSRNPWLREWPAQLRDVVPVLLPDETWAVQHAPTGQQLRLQCTALEGWQMLAVGGGQPLYLFGEWNGRSLRPLTYSVASVPAVSC